MISNTIMVGCHRVKIGETPYVLQLCGFSGPEQVRRIAARHSQNIPVMGMNDVVEWFHNYIDQEEGVE